MKIAFAGLRHGHVFGLLNRIQSSPDPLQILGGWEPNDAARATAESKGISCHYSTLDELLSDPACDIVAVGATYGERAAIICAALRAGKHVLSDKPFCTTKAELAEIRELCEKPGAPRLGCMFDLGTTPAMATAQKAVQDGLTGDLLAIQFNGQHPLNYHKGRPDWYFEPGMHGGTINDLASHAFDYIPQLAGKPIEKILFAHADNVAFPECPHFQNVAQVGFLLQGGCAATGDVSYSVPKFNLPSYWRFTVTGTKAWMEFNYGKPEVYISSSSDIEPALLPPAPPMPDYFDGFLAEIAGKPTAFTTERHLETAYWCLEANVSS